MPDLAALRLAWEAHDRWALTLHGNRAAQRVGAGVEVTNRLADQTALVAEALGVSSVSLVERVAVARRTRGLTLADAITEVCA